MKKLILSMILLFTILYSSIAFAADRWQWIISDDTYGVFFDTYTITYENNIYGSVNKNIVNVWEKFVYADGYENANAETFDDFDFKHIKYALYHEKIDFLNRKHRTIHTTFYDINNHVFSIDVNNDWVDILPDTNSEKIFFHIQHYVKTNNIK